MLHLHFTKWTPETEVQLSPAERRWRLFKQQGGSQINTFLVLKVTSKGWQWEGSQGAISYLFVLWSDLSLDKVPGLITVSVLRSNQGPLQMFSRLEVPDVGEGWRRQLVLLTGCWRPLKCFVRFEISRISSSDVCRNWKLCFLTLAGHFNEFFFFFVQRCEDVSEEWGEEKKKVSAAVWRNPATRKKACMWLWSAVVLDDINSFKWLYLHWWHS